MQIVCSKQFFGTGWVLKAQNRYKGCPYNPLAACTTNFRNSPFLPLFGALITKIHNQKYILSLQSDFSEPVGVRKLKLGINDVHITLWRRVQRISKIRHFYPFLGPKIPKFITENAYCLQSDFSELVGVGKLKLGTNDVNMAL